MDNKDTLLLVNKLDEVEKLPSFLDTFCQETGIDQALIFNLNLALEEALVNVINYAYPDDGTEYPITLQVQSDASRIVFTLRDQGTPFDPTGKEDADITLTAEERPIGGLGIFLVKQLMDEVTYTYSEGQNILSMVKNL